MNPEWEYAHTDHTAYRQRPAPAGLADTDADWQHHLHHGTPNGALMGRGNAQLHALASGGPLYLMHTTAALDAIRSSGQVLGAGGCLVGALYCAPLTPTAAGLRPHNLGSYLMETKGHRDVVVIEITPAAPAPPEGVDYLRLGGIHLDTYREHQYALTAAEDERLRAAAVRRVRDSADFLDLLLANASGTTTDGAEFLDRLSHAITGFPFLGYLYFEVLSEYLMLHSASPESRACAELGEMNNRLYKRLAFNAVPSMDRLFDLALFRPGHRRLAELIGAIEPGLAEAAPAYVRRRLAHLFATTALDAGQDVRTATFHGADFDDLAEAAPRLLGQLLFRELRAHPRYPQLFSLIEQAKAHGVYAYWNSRRITAPYNGFLPKGEIGVNLATPAPVTLWTARTCERGLLHPQDQIAAALHPRLADLQSTALGKAAFTPHTTHPALQPAH
ncbi:hypothetical protein ACIQI7_08830 [Kitasatospora sp. NPDC092039]|uniref:hypothetical protein n=1 Tax=Kitasatospora sp. NPDC092039 TaxID=3364086 RepID=UPI0038150097